MRVALYFTPPMDAPLARLAAEWLGRDAFSREPAPPPEPWLVDPARYGFHATMKAPFRLRDGRTLQELDAALARFCAGAPAVVVERLVLRRLGRFFALVPDGAEPGLSDLAEETVRRFEPFRAPLIEAELARRAPDRLTARQRALLADWGYPYVFDEFRFHMTLTGPVTDDEAPGIETRLTRHFASVLGPPLNIDGLALFVEAAPGQPFHVHARYPLSPASPTSPT